MQHYNNPQCVDVEEFNDDLRKIKYIKRLFNQYHTEGTLKERLILNHLIVFFNVFPARAATRILFLKIDEVFWPMLKTFLLYNFETSLSELNTGPLTDKILPAVVLPEASEPVIAIFFILILIITNQPNSDLFQG